MVGSGGRGRTKGERMSKRKFRMRKCKLVKNTIEYTSFILWLTRSSLLLLFAVGFAWACTQDRPRLWVVCLLLIFVWKSWFAKQTHVTREEMKLTIYAFSEFFMARIVCVSSPRTEFLAMTSWPLFQYCNVLYSANTFFLFCCLWLAWYNFYSVVFPLYLSSSCLDNYFGKIECFPIAVAMLTDASLSDRLCRAKPGTLVAM